MEKLKKETKGAERVSGDQNQNEREWILDTNMTPNDNKQLLQFSDYTTNTLCESYVKVTDEKKVTLGYLHESLAYYIKENASCIGTWMMA